MYFRSCNVCLFFLPGEALVTIRDMFAFLLTNHANAQRIQHPIASNTRCQAAPTLARLVQLMGPALHGRLCRVRATHRGTSDPQLWRTGSSGTGRWPATNQPSLGQRVASCRC